MDERTQHISSFVVDEFGPYVTHVASQLTGDSVDLSAKLFYAFLERLACGPELAFGDEGIDVEVPAELVEAGFRSSKISFPINDWFIEDYYDMLEEAESGSEDGSLGSVGVNAKAASFQILPTSVLPASGVTPASHPATADATEDEPDEWVLQCCGVVLMCGPVEEMIEEAERLDADDGFPEALTDYLVVVSAKAREPRVAEDLSERGGSHPEFTRTRAQGSSFQDFLNDALKRLGL